MQPIERVLDLLHGEAVAADVLLVQAARWRHSDNFFCTFGGLRCAVLTENLEAGRLVLFEAEVWIRVGAEEEGPEEVRRRREAAVAQNLRGEELPAFRRAWVTHNA